MARGYQQFIIQGNVGQVDEPREVKVGSDGKTAKVINFTVAVNSKVNDRPITDWYRVAAWHKLAELQVGVLKKGMQVFVVADKLQVDAYETADGPRASATLRAKEIVWLGSREGRGPQRYDEDFVPPAPDEYDDTTPPTTVDDIPF